jgi:hypothetical protein
MPYGRNNQEEERESSRLNDAKTIEAFLESLQVELGAVYGVSIPSGEYLTYSDVDSTISKGKQTVSVRFSPRSFGSYRPIRNGKIDVRVGGYGGRRFPARKAGLPLAEIAKEICDTFEEDARAAVSRMEQESQRSKTKGAIDSIHLALGIDITGYRLPRLEIGSNSAKVKISLPEMTIDQAERVLVAAMKTLK